MSDCRGSVGSGSIRITRSEARWWDRRTLRSRRNVLQESRTPCPGTLFGLVYDVGVKTTLAQNSYEKSIEGKSTSRPGRVMKENEMIVLPTKEGYDRWSKIYEEDGNPLIILEESHVARMLGNVTGLAILDVGCGTGRHSIQLAKLGGKVTGLDFSTGMLRQARSKAGADLVTFVEHDIAQSFPFDAGTFDRVLCCLVLDHVVDLPTFFSELRRVCRPDGFVVTSVMHPAMLLKGVQARFTDPSTGSEVRPESSRHQVSDYIMGAVAAGLRIVEVSEHLVDEALVLRSERARKHLGWPLLFMMRLSP